MSTAVIAFAPIPDTPLPTGATFSGSYRFSIVNPADGSAVQSKDSTDTTVTFTGLPEVPLLLKVQSVGTDGALFNDASVQQFSGVPPAPAPTVYAAPGALTITVSPDA